MNTRDHQLKTRTIRPGGASYGRAFTLIELMVVLTIIIVLIGISAFAFRKVTDGTVLAQSRNMVVTYAKIARSYAIANRIETMMVVNPFNGRFELWHMNPPYFGGPFDPLSGSTDARDGYAFAPIFDSSARLPLDGDGRPLAAVHPIDFADPLDPLTVNGPTYRSANDDAEDRNIDNLTWAAFCFDENGRLVVRSRRIATRTFTTRDGVARLPVDRNRLIDETPDLTVLAQYPPRPQGVGPEDTAITSTRGFIISDATRLRIVAPQYNRIPFDLVTNWLFETLPGGRTREYSTTVVLNRFSGQEMIGEAP